MSKARIRAGTMEQLKHPRGQWAIVDVGFAMSPKKTCGFLVSSLPQHDELPEPRNLTYGELTNELKTIVTKADVDPLHLVLEAPLSAAFDDVGNPVGRSCERYGSKTRYWYVGLGCSILVASLYLIKNLVDALPRREIRLFEAFVSFKDSDKESDHRHDVKAILSVLTRGPDGESGFFEPEALRTGCTLTSVLQLLGLDETPPPIIRVPAP